MQRILYGMTLEEHVRVDVIANGLLKPVPERPDVLFVDELSLVAVRKVAGIPTAFLKKADDSAAVEQKLTTLMYDTGGNTADQEFIGQVLAKLETQCDLVEPFARMREALKEVIKNAGK